jgi:hypothetical protein
VTEPAGSDDRSVADVIASLDEATAQDCRVLIELMRRISGHEPRVWNVGTLGFDTYHYKYDSGREGDGTHSASTRAGGGRPST